MRFQADDFIARLYYSPKKKKDGILKNLIKKMLLIITQVAEEITMQIL